MVRTTKTAPATEKVSKKTSEKKTVEKKEAAPAPAPENVVEAPADVSPVAAKFAEVGASIQKAFGVVVYIQ